MRSKKHKEKPIAIDLFSGCGGLTVGLKAAGFRVVAAVEIEALSVKTYKKNHADVEVWETDIRNLQPQDILKRLNLKRGDIDLIAGCPPCQGFSTLRTLNGAVRVHDRRNGLLKDFQRFIEVLRPRAVMMENVPRLADKKHFFNFCKALRDLGYLGNYQVLDAAHFSVPQRRRRLIYLAGLGVEIPFVEKGGKPKTVKDAIGHLPRPGKSGDPVHDIPECRSDKVMAIIRHIPKDGGSRATLPSNLELACHKRCSGFLDVYGRMAWDEVSPTITSGCFNPSKGRFLHPYEDRAITIREAALLQGFPRKYKFSAETGKEALAAMIGNALPPPFIAAHSKSIRCALEASAKPSSRRSNRLGGRG